MFVGGPLLAGLAALLYARRLMGFSASAAVGVGGVVRYAATFGDPTGGIMKMLSIFAHWVAAARDVYLLAQRDR